MDISIARLQDAIDQTKMELVSRRMKKKHDDACHRQSVQDKMKQMKTMLQSSKNIDTMLHAYASALKTIQQQVVPSLPTPTYVVLKQTLLCRALHRMEVQVKLVELAEAQCSDLIRTIRSRMHDLEDEFSMIESDLLHRIALTRADIAIMMNLTEKNRKVNTRSESLSLCRGVTGVETAEEDQQECKDIETEEWRDLFNRSMNNSVGALMHFFEPNEKSMEDSVDTFLQDSFNTTQTELDSLTRSQWLIKS